MQPSSSPPVVLPPDWTHVLETIQSALAQALTETSEREQALAQGFPAGEPSPASPAAELGEDFGQGIHRFQSCYLEAERQAAAVAAGLQADQEAIQQWLAAAIALRQRLARTPAPSLQ
jgi:hypothetical protein